MVTSGVASFFPVARFPRHPLDGRRVPWSPPLPALRLMGFSGSSLVSVPARREFSHRGTDEAAQNPGLRLALSPSRMKSCFERMA